MGLPRFKPPPPRQKAYVDTLDIATKRASLLTPAEIAETIAPARECEARLREGVATDDQHAVLYTSLLIAKGIEDTGIVRGLREHIDSAIKAMDAIRARATASGAWLPTELHFSEIKDIREALHLHEYQLGQVSAGELQAIAQKLIARTTSTGGQVQHRTHRSLGLQTA